MCMSLNEIAIAIVACLRLADGYVDLQRIGFLYIFIHFYIDEDVRMCWPIEKLFLLRL